MDNQWKSSSKQTFLKIGLHLAPWLFSNRMSAAFPFFWEILRGVPPSAPTALTSISWSSINIFTTRREVMFIGYWSCIKSKQCHLKKQKIDKTSYSATQGIQICTILNKEMFTLQDSIIACIMQQVEAVISHNGWISTLVQEVFSNSRLLECRGNHDRCSPCISFSSC